MFEVEQKFRVGDFGEIEERLEKLGATIKGPIVQVDSYFAHPARDFAETDEAFRIRQVGELNYVTYKGPKIDATTKTRREIELPLVSGETHADEFRQLLAALSFAPVAAVRKTRRNATLPWKGWKFEVALDEVAGLGKFVELEVAAGESELEDARAALLTLADELSLIRVERTSYLELLLAVDS